MKIEEVRIPAPWGHIAVKLWGDPENPPILGIHGVFDNAGAFDNLIPYLPENFYYICVDLPSHGRSSNFHLSLPIHTMDYIVPMKIIADYFKREKYILMGHSLGGQLSMLYAQIYPNTVARIILIDSMYLFPYSASIFLEVFEKALDRLFKLVDQNQKPRSVYTYEGAIQKLIDGRDHGKMTKAAAEPLARRMFEKIDEDKYVMNIDPRLKERLYPNGTMDFLVKVHKKRPIKCPVLVLLSTDRALDWVFGPLYEHYVESGYEIHKYDGHHDVHNTNPEKIADFIINFLLKNKSKL